MMARTLPSNIAEGLVILVAIVLGAQLPVQVLWPTTVLLPGRRGQIITTQQREASLDRWPRRFRMLGRSTKRWERG